MAILIAGCGSEEPSPPEAIATPPTDPALRSTPLALPEAAESRVVFWVQGTEAALELEFEGGGELAITARSDADGPVLEEALRNEAGGRLRARVELPGPPGRALAVDLEASEEIRWHSVNLVERSLPHLAGESRALRGGLAGRTLVLVLLDALHSAHLGCYGNELDHSPHLDRLAREGVCFSTAYSQTSWTVPSVASLFTGLDQEGHGMRSFGLSLPAELPTLSDAFQTAGHHTRAWVQNPNLDPRTGLGRGFDEWHWTEEKTESADLVDACCAAIGETEDDPGFLYLHIMPPHAPYIPPAPFRGRFGRGPNEKLDGSAESIQRINKRGLSPGNAAFDRMRGMYDDHVAYGDSLVGKVIAAIESSGRPEDFALVVISDHGEALGQRGLVGHNYHVFEEMVRVPLLLWAPDSKLPVGETVDVPVTLMDLGASLRELFALPSSPLSAGRSWVALLEGAPKPPPRLLRLSARYSRDGPLQHGVVAGRFKLIAGRGRTSLFDLETDPGETTDRSQDHPILTAALTAEARRWLDDAVAEPQARFGADEALRARLKELGYSQDE